MAKAQLDTWLVIMDLSAGTSATERLLVIRPSGRATRKNCRTIFTSAHRLIDLHGVINSSYLSEVTTKHTIFTSRPGVTAAVSCIQGLNGIEEYLQALSSDKDNSTVHLNCTREDPLHKLHNRAPQYQAFLVCCAPPGLD